MCRSHDHGGRRCPSTRQAARETERARKAAWRARTRLSAAESGGDPAAIETARRRAAEADAALADARRQAEDRGGEEVPPALRPQQGRDTREVGPDMDGPDRPGPVSGPVAGPSPVVPEPDSTAGEGRDVPDLRDEDRRQRDEALAARRAALAPYIEKARTFRLVARVGDTVEVDQSGRIRDARTHGPITGVSHEDLQALRDRLHTSANDCESRAARAASGDEAAELYSNVRRLRMAADHLTTDPGWFTVVRAEDIAVGIDGRLRRAGGPEAAPITPAEAAATRVMLAEQSRTKADEAAAARARGADAAAAEHAGVAQLLDVLAEHATVDTTPL